MDYLRSEKYRDIIDKIRNESDKAKRDQLKRTFLPGITPSGTFTQRSEQGLIQHSGLLAGDIDFKDNPFDPLLLRAQLANLVNVAYCGLSASGQGLWFLVPITDPLRHKAHFSALANDFLKLGIRLDPAPANVASFRFYSFDVEAHFNPTAKPYTKLHVPKPSKKYKALNDSNHLVSDKIPRLEETIRRIEKSRSDITQTYSAWFQIGCALAAEFGEGGRTYFHRVSQFNSDYHAQETDRQYTACLRWRGNRSGLGSFYYWVKKFGIG
jgi:hypothetical protein